MRAADTTTRSQSVIEPNTGESETQEDDRPSRATVVERMHTAIDKTEELRPSPVPTIDVTPASINKSAPQEMNDRYRNYDELYAKY